MSVNSRLESNIEEREETRNPKQVVKLTAREMSSSGQNVERIVKQVHTP